MKRVVFFAIISLFVFGLFCANQANAKEGEKSKTSTKEEDLARAKRVLDLVRLCWGESERDHECISAGLHMIVFLLRKNNLPPAAINASLKETFALAAVSAFEHEGLRMCIFEYEKNSGKKITCEKEAKAVMENLKKARLIPADIELNGGMLAWQI